MMLGRTNMLRKIIAAFFLLIFLSLTGFLIYSALQPEKLPVGALLPSLEYLTANGAETLKADGSRQALVLYFHSDCKYCQYELGLLNENLPKFNQTRLYLLTPEEDFFSAKKMQSWSNLVNSPVVSWGIVDGSEFKEKFGGKGFPTTFIFDHNGVLLAKIFGEAKLDKIVSELKKNPGGPERRVSGL